jgi:hypothetical protein
MAEPKGSLDNGRAPDSVNEKAPANGGGGGGGDDDNNNLIIITGLRILPPTSHKRHHLRQKQNT